MASKLGLIEKLQQEFCRCTICFEEYDEITHIPRMLPCQHTFCSDCLRRHCSKTKIKCPNCNQEYPIRNRNIQVFPKDITRSNLMDVVGKDISKNDCCEICSRKGTPLLSCRECNIHFCQMCRKSQEQKGCRNHTVLDQAISWRTQTSQSCVCLLEGHEHNELKFYCETAECMKPVCANCVVETHKDHNYVKITHVYENKKKIMLERLFLTKGKIKVALKTATKLKSEMSKLQDSRSTIRSFLEHTVEVGLQFLNKQKKQIEKRHSKFFDEKMQHVECRLQTLNSFIENAKECCTVSDEALSKYDLIKFLSFERLISDKLDTFNNFEFEENIESVDAENQGLKSEVSNLNEKINFMTETKTSTKCESQGPTMVHEAHWLIRGLRSLKDLIFAYCIAFVVIFLMSFLLHGYLVIDLPYCSIFSCEDSYLQLRNSTRNKLTTCISKDRTTFSNVPLEGTLQQCDKKDKLYVYKGIFVNKTLDPISDFVDIKVGLRDVKEQLVDGRPLIEFGISSGSLHGRSLDSLYQLDVYGWYIYLASNMRIKIVNILNFIVYDVNLQLHSNEFHFKLRVQVSGSSNIYLILLNNNDYTVILDHQIFKTKMRGRKFVFVSLRENSAADPYVRLINKQTVFNETTAYSNIKLSGSKKHISIMNGKGIQQSGHDISSVFISLNNCSKSCFYSLLLKFETSTSTDESTDERFHVYFDQENQVLKKQKLYLFSYGNCYILSLIGKRKSSTCLFFNRNMEGYEKFVEVLPGHWHRILFHFNKPKHTFTIQIRDNTFHLKNPKLIYKTLPLLHIESSAANPTAIQLEQKESYPFFDWLIYSCSRILALVPNIFIYSNNFVKGGLMIIFLSVFFTTMDEERRRIQDFFLKIQQFFTNNLNFRR